MNPEKSVPLKRRFQKISAQAMIEFAIVLPLLLLLLYGVVELARLAFIFTSTSNASRAAARYGSGAGDNADGTPHYLDCEGIRKVADESAYITDFTQINITYDRGVDSNGRQIPITGVDPSPETNSCPLDNVNVRNGDRIVVQVSANYEPIIPIVPLDPLKIVSSSARTFIVSIPIMGSAVPTGFAAESSTPSSVALSIGTNTPTFTAAPTSTRVPIDLTKFAYDLTNAPSPTLTFTPSMTPLPTYTPTVIPTRISCGGATGLSHGPLQIRDNYLQMGINNNTGYSISVSEVYIEWNHDKGHQAIDPTLRLSSVSLNNQNWTGDIFAPFQYIRDYRPSIPVETSFIRFGFNQSYDVLDGTERIIISLSTPGCENYSIDSDN